MGRTKAFSRLFGAALILVALAGCGGGGGGDAGADPMAYTGKSTEAAVTQDNAETLALNAYQQGSAGSAAGSAGIRSGATGSAAKPRTALLARALIQTMAQVEQRSAASRSARAVASDTLYGACGGSATYTIDYDEASGSFSGTFAFSDYCDMEMTMNGSLSFSGTVDEFGEFVQFSMSVNALSMTICGESVTMSGDMAFEMSGAGTVTMNMRMLDGSGKVYKVENFTSSVVDLYTEVRIELSGTFYDPDHGYVAMTTQSPLVIYEGDYWPSSGVLVLEGANGTTVSLTASSTGYLIEADTDGDGVPDLTDMRPWPNAGVCP